MKKTEENKREEEKIGKEKEGCCEQRRMQREIFFCTEFERIDHFLADPLLLDSHGK